MAEINWGLAAGGNNALSMFKLGASLGSDLRQRQDQRRSENALRGIISGGMGGVGGMDPKRGIGGGIIEQREAEAAQPNWGDLSGRDLNTALQFRRDQTAQARQQQEQRRADLPTVTRLLESATDEASYQRNRAYAQQLGIDVSTLPPQFDPAWRDQQIATMKALQDPAKAEALSTAGKQAVDMGYKPGTPEFNAKVSELFNVENSKLIPTQPGGGVARYNAATGATEFVIQPNDGSQPVGAAVGGGPALGAIEDGYRFKGGNPADPSSWEPVGQGGGGQRVTSGFLDGL